MEASSRALSVHRRNGSVEAALICGLFLVRNTAFSTARVNRRVLRERNQRYYNTIKVVNHVVRWLAKLMQTPRLYRIRASIFLRCRMNPKPDLRPGSTDPKSRLRGRPFEKGNGGRRPGSRNRTTQLAEALLEGEEGELVRKAIELAKAGDVPMLKFLLERILPKERSVRIDLPELDRSSGAIDALAAVIDAVATGRIVPSEAAALASLAAALARTIDVAETEERLEIVEKAVRDLKLLEI